MLGRLVAITNHAAIVKYQRGGIVYERGLVYI